MCRLQGFHGLPRLKLLRSDSPKCQATIGLQEAEGLQIDERASLQERLERMSPAPMTGQVDGFDAFRSQALNVLTGPGHGGHLT
jgi:hypothetical protein